MATPRFWAKENKLPRTTSATETPFDLASSRARLSTAASSMTMLIPAFLSRPRLSAFRSEKSRRALAPLEGGVPSSLLCKKDDDPRHRPASATIPPSSKQLIRAIAAFIFRGRAMTRDETVALFLECEAKRAEARAAALSNGKSEDEARGIAHKAAKVHWNAWASDRLAERKSMEESGAWAAKKNNLGALEAKNDETSAWLQKSSTSFDRCHFLTREAETPTVSIEQSDGGELKSITIHVTERAQPAADKSADIIKRFGANGPPFVTIQIENTQFDLRGFIFPGNASFYNSFFFADIRFEKILCHGSAQFECASFESNAWFDDAAFEGDTRFNSTAFQGAAYFVGAAFKEQASFWHATFKNIVSFSNAAFQRDARFDCISVERNAKFDEAAFHGYTSFESALLKGTASFRNAAFKGNAWLQGVTFQGGADFSKAAFHDRTHFNASKFSRGISASAVYKGAVFKSKASFMSTKFEVNASFSDVAFQQEVEFDNTTFDHEARFINALFGGHSAFASVNFNGKSLSGIILFSGKAFAT
jgi:hypothetical protein